MTATRCAPTPAVLIRREEASERGLHAEQREEVRRVACPCWISSRVGAVPEDRLPVRRGHVRGDAVERVRVVLAARRTSRSRSRAVENSPCPGTRLVQVDAHHARRRSRCVRARAAAGGRPRRTSPRSRRCPARASRSRTPRTAARGAVRARRSEHPARRASSHSRNCIVRSR